MDIRVVATTTTYGSASRGAASGGMCTADVAIAGVAVDEGLAGERQVTALG